MLRGLNSVLLVLLLALQWRFWYGDGGRAEVRSLSQEVAHQTAAVEALRDRNRMLAAEVQDLKHHQAALEERARVDLGMIKTGETFYQLAD